MNVLVKKIPLANGLTVFMHDCTYRYYGDFYLVKIEIICEVPVCEEYFEDREDFLQARKLLGEGVSYRRILEQMGVPSTGIEYAREMLMQNFIDHSLPYFSTARFPGKFVLSRYTKAKRRPGRQVA